MPRNARSDVDLLLQEAHAIELLASETDVAPGRLQDYWDVSADLIALVADLEEFQRTHPVASYEQPEMLDMRRRLRAIASRMTQLGE